MQLRLQTSNAITYPISLPSLVRIILVCIFALLWATWIQPHTIGLRHALLTAGSILGLYVTVQNYRLFKTRVAIPIYLIGLLLVWITFHLFFIGQRYELQLAEFLTLWKRIVWGVPFAIGLGLALGCHGESRDSQRNGYSGVWWIFYVGVAAPTVIYLTKLSLMFLAGIFGWHLPNILMILPSSSTWHVTKMGVIFFCLPALALACSQCISLTNKKTQYSVLFFSIFIGTIAAVLAVFYFENAKNGMAYSVFLIFATLVKIAYIKKSQWGWRDSIISAVAIAAVVFLLVQHVQKNNAWKTFVADIKVASNIDQSDAWKDYGARGYPMNEMGVPVTETNYVRAVWAQVAVRFIAEKPMGYGLIDGSFGSMAKEKWPSSRLFQAHSAWLDLTLGIGIPGIFLLVFAGILSLRNALQITPDYWGTTALWVLLSIALLMITTEVSRPPYIDALVFLILWVAGLGLGQQSKSKPSKVLVAD